MLDLKNCPFCGGRNVAQGASRDYISVWCTCGARGPDVPFPDDCIDPATPIRKCHELWNRRALQAVGPEPVAITTAPEYARLCVAADNLSLAENIEVNKTDLRTVLGFISELQARSALVATPPAEQHPDEIAVDCFAAAMKAKLKWEREQRNRSGWQAMSAADLSRILYEHLPKGDPVDVANLSMMLHQNGQQIVTPPAEPVVEAHPVYEELVRSRSKELHQKLGRDAMLRQNDPVQTIYEFAWSIWHDGFGEGMNEAALATKPAVKDDETVVAATARNYVADKETYPRQITFADGRIVRLMTDFANGINYLEVGSADARAALAAKDGRS